MTKSGMLTPTNMTEALDYAKMMASSSMVPANFKYIPADVLVAVQWGYEVGLPPMSALQNIAVINGKPSIYGDAALALITSHKQYGGHKEWLEGDTAYCVIKRKVGDEVVETKQSFSEKDAKLARLWGKQGPWSQYPERMLQMRARGFAMRDSFPDALKGVITVEEAQDYPAQEMKDITPKNPLDSHFKAESVEIEAEISPQNASSKDLGSNNPKKTNAPETALNQSTNDFVFILHLGNETIEFLDGESWHEGFVAEISKISNDKGLSFEDRRHNAGEFKKANDETLDLLEKENNNLYLNIAQRYKKMLAHLSIKAKEALK